MPSQNCRRVAGKRGSYPPAPNPPLDDALGDSVGAPVSPT